MWQRQFATIWLTLLIKGGILKHEIHWFGPLWNIKHKLSPLSLCLARYSSKQQMLLQLAFFSKFEWVTLHHTCKKVKLLFFRIIILLHTEQNWSSHFKIVVKILIKLWDRFPSFVLLSLRFQLQQAKTFGKNYLLPRVMWKKVDIIGEQQENEQKILLHKEIFAYIWQWQGLNIVPYHFKSSHILLFLLSHKVMIMIITIQ